MIRINLLGRAKSRRRIGVGLPHIPNVGILFFLLLMVIEAASLFTIHADANEQANRLTKKAKRIKRVLAETQKVQAQLTTVRKELSTLKKQALLFEELQAEKRGPLGALSYLSFILKPRDEARDPADELKRLESAGWRVGWDAGRAWFTEVSEELGTVTLKGEAINHDDVAEVLRRLESAAHFRNVELVWQERHADKVLQIDYVKFSAKADLIYLTETYLTAAQRAAKAEAEKMAAAAAAAKAAAAAEQQQSPEPKAEAAVVVKGNKDPRRKKEVESDKVVAPSGASPTIEPAAASPTTAAPEATPTAKDGP